MVMDLLETGKSLAKASEIIDALLEGRDKAIFEAAVSPVNKLILSAHRDVVSAYSEQLSLLKQKGDLEKRIADLEAWAAERRRYELYEVVVGTFAYQLKEGAANGEPIHLICANCYEDGKKARLYRRPKSVGREMYLDCPACKTSMMVEGGGIQQVQR